MAFYFNYAQQTFWNKTNGICQQLRCGHFEIFHMGKSEQKQWLTNMTGPNQTHYQPSSIMYLLQHQWNEMWCDAMHMIIQRTRTMKTNCLVWCEYPHILCFRMALPLFSFRLVIFCIWSETTKQPSSQSIATQNLWKIFSSRENRQILILIQRCIHSFTHSLSFHKPLYLTIIDWIFHFSSFSFFFLCFTLLSV